MILFRPVGLDELVLVFRSKMRAFPPRRPEQPIFYPVLNEEYAREIAQRWNATSGAMAGFVTEFEVDDDYARSFEVHRVGSRIHEELWVPAETLPRFNEHIAGTIRLTAAFFGPEFVGVVPAAFSLRGKGAGPQLEALRGIHAYSAMDFHGEIVANAEAVFAHFPYWEQLVSRAPECAPVLVAIRQAWSGAFPGIPVGVQPRRPTVAHAPDGPEGEVERER
jgi:hypothetical protein